LYYTSLAVLCAITAASIAIWGWLHLRFRSRLRAEPTYRIEIGQQQQQNEKPLFVPDTGQSHFRVWKFYKEKQHCFNNPPQNINQIKHHRIAAKKMIEDDTLWQKLPKK
jgi:hypothetical protein